MINPYSLLWLIWILLMPGAVALAQPHSITLSEAHTLATENYPLIKRRSLIAQSAIYSIEQANADYLPQINLNGQATYQSAVTQIPLKLPGMDVPVPDKDQYKLYGEVNQSLYDGGSTKLKKQALEATERVDQQTLEVELYALKERVNQLFFGILSLDAQLAQNNLLRGDISAGLEKASAAIANGAALKSSGSLLEAELLKSQQHATELRTTRKAYLLMLGLFIGRTLDEQTALEKPLPPPAISTVNRPELTLFIQQQARIDVERKLLSAKNRPKLGLFLQAGLGRPALNMLSNDFEAYYYGGVRFAVPLSGFYTIKTEKTQLDIRKATLDVQKETFLFNTSLALEQQHTEVAKYEELLSTDDDIIALRSSVKEAALIQLENGVINTADYVREVHAEDGAKLARIVHELQLLKAQYDMNYTSGN